jgi:hypothetical protein
MSNTEHGVHPLAFTDDTRVIAAPTVDALIGFAGSDDTPSALPEHAVTRFADAVNAPPRLALACYARASAITRAKHAGKRRMGDAEYSVHVVAFADDASVLPTLAEDPLVIVADPNNTSSPCSKYAVSSNGVVTVNGRQIYIVRTFRDGHVLSPFTVVNR